VGDLTLAELSQIDHICLTHSHLDHVASIPFLVDTVGGMRTKPITVYASRATIEILKNHLFNWAIWPDFSEIPTPEAPFLRYQELELGGALELSGRKITALPAKHTVPAVGYQLDSGEASLVFTGDTGPNDALWKIVNRIGNLKYLIIETAFSNKERKLAEMSRPPVSGHAGRGAEEARAQRRDLHHPHEAGRDRADHARDRGVAQARSGRACCRTTWSSSSRP
jgi:ribonuclease BN (tRNA processing enzyme)